MQHVKNHRHQNQVFWQFQIPYVVPTQYFGSNFFEVLLYLSAYIPSLLMYVFFYAKIFIFAQVQHICKHVKRTKYVHYAQLLLKWHYCVTKINCLLSEKFINKSLIALVMEHCLPVVLGLNKGKKLIFWHGYKKFY